MWGTAVCIRTLPKAPEVSAAKLSWGLPRNEEISEKKEDTEREKNRLCESPQRLLLLIKAVYLHHVVLIKYSTRLRIFLEACFLRVTVTYG